jgi:hypothetical protein
MMAYIFSNTKNKILFLIIGILLVSCNPEVGNQNSFSSTIQNENFDWLIGNWKRVHEDQGKRTFETWSKINDSEYIGFGCTTHGKDTIWQEDLILNLENNTWNLEVKSPNESVTTVFEMTSSKVNEFVCENPEHDFPKVIKYWKNGKGLYALVSDDEIEILFEFEKLNE